MDSFDPKRDELKSSERLTLTILRDRMTLRGKGHCIKEGQERGSGRTVAEWLFYTSLPTVQAPVRAFLMLLSTRTFLSHSGFHRNGRRVLPLLSWWASQCSSLLVCKPFRTNPYTLYLMVRAGIFSSQTDREWKNTRRSTRTPRSTSTRRFEISLERIKLCERNRVKSSPSTICAWHLKCIVFEVFN